MFQVRNISLHIAIYNMPCIIFLAGWDASCQEDFRRKKLKGGKMDAKWLGPFLLSRKRVLRSCKFGWEECHNKEN